MMWTQVKMAALAVTVAAASVGITLAGETAKARNGASGKAKSKIAGLTIFQDLEEITSRIPNLKDKPYARLIDKEGFYQPEITIFNDVETRTEVWSLTREICIRQGNYERYPCWSWNGQYACFVGNRKFRGLDGSIKGGRWDGHNYLVNADFSKGRKFFANVDGKLQGMTARSMIWDRSGKPILYFAFNDKLWTVTVGQGVKDNKAEGIFTFPNNKRKFIRILAENNKLCVQEVNGKNMQDMPSYYIIDLNKKQGDDGFVRSHTFSYGIKGVKGHDPENEYRVHGIGLSRDGSRVGWSYGSNNVPGEKVGFGVAADNLNAKPVPRSESEFYKKWGQKYGHNGVGPGGRIVGFAMGTDKIAAAGGPKPEIRSDGTSNYYVTCGLWVAIPGKVPQFTGKILTRGHATWCGADPDCWFSHADNFTETWTDKTFINSIVVGTSDAKIKILCRPYDALRGNRTGKWKNTGTEKKIRPLPPYAGFPRPIQSPDASKCYFNSSMLMPSDMTAGGFVAVHRRPYPPVFLTIKGKKDKLLFSWKLHKISLEVRGVNIYMKRKGGNDDAWRQINDSPLLGDKAKLPVKLKNGSYLFMATCEEWSRLESDTTSGVVSVTISNSSVKGGQNAGKGISGWDKTSPRPVKGFSAVKDPAGFTKLQWEPNTEKDFRYYNIYASSSGGNPQSVQRRLLVSPPKKVTEYLDWSAPKGKEFKYAIVAIDRQGNRSDPVFVSGQP